MDSASQLNQLESQLASCEAWTSHPMFRALLEQNEVEQEKAVTLITEGQIAGLGDLATREQAIGHLRGLRYFNASVQVYVEEIKQQIQDLN